MQPWINLSHAIAAVAGVLAAILAWIAKIRWSTEFAATKDETIRAKEAQIRILGLEIASLRELTPMGIREYFVSMRLQLEEYNDTLKNQIAVARAEIAARDEEINNLAAHGQQQQAELNLLKNEKALLPEHVETPEAQVETALDIEGNPYPRLDQSRHYESLSKAFSSTDNASHYIRNPNNKKETDETLASWKNSLMLILGATWAADRTPRPPKKNQDGSDPDVSLVPS